MNVTAVMTRRRRGKKTKKQHFDNTQLSASMSDVTVLVPCVSAAPSGSWPWRAACLQPSCVSAGSGPTSCSSTTRRTWPSSEGRGRTTTWRTTKTVTTHTSLPRLPKTVVTHFHTQVLVCPCFPSVHAALNYFKCRIFLQSDAAPFTLLHSFHLSVTVSTAPSLKVHY